MKTIEIYNVKDFDLTHIFECGQCFRWRALRESAGAGGHAGGGITDAEGSGFASGLSPRTSFIGAAGDIAAVITYSDGVLRIDATGGSEPFWRDYFDLGTDYGEIKRTLISSEPLIEKAAVYGGGIRILRQDTFETIISFIISQNNNIPRIRKNIESLCVRYGSRIEGSEELLCECVRKGLASEKELSEMFGSSADELCIHAFPVPSALAEADEDELAAMKLGYRSSYIRAAAARYMDEGCPDCRESLLSFLGVGPKVANCIMLFGLRDTAAFPVDTWVKHIMNDMYGFDEDDVKGMQAFASERFGELAGYAQQYLFYYYRDRSRKS